MNILLFVLGSLGVIGLLGGLVLTAFIPGFVDTERMDREPVADIKRMMTVTVLIPRRLLTPVGKRLLLARNWCLVSAACFFAVQLLLLNGHRVILQSAPMHSAGLASPISPSLAAALRIAGLGCLFFIALAGFLAAFVVPRLVDHEKLGELSDGTIARISRASLLPRRVLTPNGQTFWWITVGCWTMAGILLLILIALRGR